MAKPRGARQEPQRCWYCGARLTPETATTDHVLPRSRGGVGVRGNTVPACRQCNFTKDDMTLSEFRRWVSRGADDDLAEAAEHVAAVRRLLPQATAKAALEHLAAVRGVLASAVVEFHGERSVK